MNVNLGCQVHKFAGWINQDIVSDDPAYPTDWVCDANHLPTGDNTVDHLYAGHLVEHFYPDTIESYVREWYRVLKPGGQLAVITPDFGQMAKLYAQCKLTMTHLLQPAFGRIYHYDRPEERHHILFDDVSLLETFQSVRWARIEKLDYQQPPAFLDQFFKKEHISRSETQLGYLFTK